MVTTLSLPWYVDIAIIVGALAAVIAALWPIIHFFIDRADRKRERKRR